MANFLTADEIITLKHKRNYIQFGGPRPNNSVGFSGQDAQYFTIDAFSLPETGNIDPLWVPDPVRIGKYRLVGRKVTAPPLPTSQIKMRERHGTLPRQLSVIGCQLNLYENTGVCNDLSNYTQGWSDYVLIYSNGIVVKKEGGNRTAFDKDEVVEDTIDITFSDIYPVAPMSFGEGAATQVDKEVLDAAFDSLQGCGNCGVATDGASRLYAITKSSGAGSPGLPAELIYTTDGGQTWNQTNITGLGATEDPVAVDIVGDQIIVLGGTAATPAYYYADIDAASGTPGAFTKVTAGFVANKLPSDIYVASPREVYLCAAGGYVYKITNLSAGVTILNAGQATALDLLRIHGLNETLVAVGKTGAIIKSVNRGKTWASLSVSPSTLDIQAVSVLDTQVFWAGDAASHLYYTLDGGRVWHESLFAGTGVGAIYDIVFVTPEVGYVTYTTATPTGVLMTTWDGGNNWTSSAPRILNMPTQNRINRIAAPSVSGESGLNCNYVALVGLAGNGTDGIVLNGAASRF